MAFASALSVVAPQVDAAEPLTFTGTYVGVAVGGGAHKVTVDNLTLGTTFTDEEPGVIVSGYAGYNWEYCGYVLGFEADINSLSGSPTALDIEFGPTGLNETTRLKSSMDLFSTLRARAGVVVFPNAFVYATGGLALARFDRTLSDNCVGCGNSPFNLGPFAQSDRANMVGWTVGGGGELQFAPNWLLRGEALFVDLSSDTNSYIVRTPIGTGNTLAKWSDELWFARVGIAYRFDWP